MARTNLKNKLLRTRSGALVLGLTWLIVVYAIGSRALHTGSLGQYALTFIALGLSINRFYRAVHPAVTNKTK